MKIRLPGFTLALNPAYSLNKFTTDLLEQSGNVIKHAGLGRIMTVKEHGKYIVGSFVTIKDQSQIPEIDLESGKVSIRHLEAGRNLAGFNFFVIAKKNLHGLYSQCSGSAALRIFGDFLSRLGKPSIREKRQEALKEAGTGPTATAKRNDIREEYRDAVTWTYLVSKQSIAEIIAAWERLRALQFKVTHLEPGKQEFGTLQPYVKAKTTRLAFDQDSAVDRIKKQVLKFLKDAEYEDATLEGVDESGEDRRIDIAETRDWFGEHDYGKIVSDNSLFADDVLQSCLIKLMIQEANDRPDTFDSDVK